MLSEPFGNDRACIAQVARFLIANIDIESALWTEEIDDVAKQPRAFSVWATADVTDALLRFVEWTKYLDNKCEVIDRTLTSVKALLPRTFQELAGILKNMRQRSEDQLIRDTSWLTDRKNKETTRKALKNSIEEIVRERQGYSGLPRTYITSHGSHPRWGATHLVASCSALRLSDHPGSQESPYKQAASDLVAERKSFAENLAGLEMSVLRQIIDESSASEEKVTGDAFLKELADKLNERLGAIALISGAILILTMTLSTT